jgi:hypothetical protein
MSGYIVCASSGQACTFSGTRNVLIDSCFESLCSRRTVVGTGSVPCYGWTSSAVTRCAYSQTEVPAITRLQGFVASASTQSGISRSAGKAIDGDTATRWEASNSTAGSWLQLTRGEPFYLSRIEITEFGQRIRGYRVEYLSGSSWVALQEGASVGANFVIDWSGHPLLVTNGVRIVTTGRASGQPSIAEFSVFGQALPAPQ